MRHPVKVVTIIGPGCLQCEVMDRRTLRLIPSKGCTMTRKGESELHHCSHLIREQALSIPKNTSSQIFTLQLKGS